MADLTPKQDRFVEEFLVDLNATGAAKRAGYSVKTARKIGSENLSKPVIEKAIREALADQTERTRITADMVVEALWVEANLQGDDAKHSARVAALRTLLHHLCPPNVPDVIQIPTLVVGLLEHIDREHYLTPEHRQRLNPANEVSASDNGKVK